MKKIPVEVMALLMVTTLSSCCSAQTSLSAQSGQSAPVVEKKDGSALFSQNDFVLTGKQKGAGNAIQDLLKECPPHRLTDLMNDQFRLKFEDSTSDELAVQNCLKVLEKDFEIQKNRTYRLDPVIKPKRKVR